jgi:hypothetical protein
VWFLQILLTIVMAHSLAKMYMVILLLPASFLSFTEQLQIELELVETNLANNNISLAEEHAEKAAMLLTPITREIAEENKRIADELAIAVSSIQNISAIQKPLVSQFIGNIDVILGEIKSRGRIQQFRH